MNNSQKSYSEFAILMCVFNGEKYLYPQLASINSQNEKNWSLYISDDGSKDQSIKILDEWKNKLRANRVEIRKGPRDGFAKNFISLLTDPEIKASYYALCDQDDIWYADKLTAAKQFLASCDTELPALYCSRTIFVDENDIIIEPSTAPSRALTFKNALVQNIASGNTMVINQPAHNLFVNCGPDINVYAHDWLIYALITGNGGNVFYDNNVYVRYRQHGENLIGMNSHWKNKLHRLIKLLNGEFSKWISANNSFLEQHRHLLSNENQLILDLFLNSTKYSGLKSVMHLLRSGVYRQNTYENMALYISAWLGRLRKPSH
jgi:glycosyltransferase involved in cell wall biosynthesis